MAGENKTNKFMLGTCTVMVGPMADLYDLNPAEHSLGLVKNFTTTTEAEYTELTQGVTNVQVASVKTASNTNCSMEVFEYTASNLAYALGLDGTFATKTVVSTVDAEVTSGSDFDVASGDGANFAVGDDIIIINDNVDDFVVRKIDAISTDTITVNEPFGQTINAAAAVRQVNSLTIGSDLPQAYYSAKISGLDAEGNPVVFLFPKIRVTQGFNVGFVTEDFGNMPFEFTLFKQAATDPFSADFAGQASMFVQ